MLGARIRSLRTRLAKRCRICRALKICSGHRTRKILKSSKGKDNIHVKGRGGK